MNYQAKIDTVTQRLESVPGPDGHTFEDKPVYDVRATLLAADGKPAGNLTLHLSDPKEYPAGSTHTLTV